MVYGGWPYCEGPCASAASASRTARRIGTPCYRGTTTAATATCVHHGGARDVAGHPGAPGAAHFPGRIAADPAGAPAASIRAATEPARRALATRGPAGHRGERGRAAIAAVAAAGSAVIADPGRAVALVAPAAAAADGDDAEDGAVGPVGSVDRDGRAGRARAARADHHRVRTGADERDPRPNAAGPAPCACPSVTVVHLSAAAASAARDYKVLEHARARYHERAA